MVSVEAGALSAQLGPYDGGEPRADRAGLLDRDGTFLERSRAFQKAHPEATFEEAEAACSVACNGCGRCVADAAPGLIEMRSGLAVIDYTKYELATPDAIKRCPTGAIVWVEGAQQFGTRPAQLEGVAS